MGGGAIARREQSYLYSLVQITRENTQIPNFIAVPSESKCSITTSKQRVIMQLLPRSTDLVLPIVHASHCVIHSRWGHVAITKGHGN